MVYLLLGACTYGMHLPTGVILPSLALGATAGRLFGQVCLPVVPARTLTRTDRTRR